MRRLAIGAIGFLILGSVFLSWNGAARAFSPTTEPATGSCCVGGAGGTCSEMTSEACNSAGGTYRGDNTTCSTQPCPPATGSCCVGGTNGTCSEMTSASCSAAAGAYAGDNTTCATNPCPTAPTGACCPKADGFECTQETRAGCDNRNGRWQGVGTSCTNCPPCPLFFCGLCFFQSTILTFLGMVDMKRRIRRKYAHRRVSK